MKMKRLLTLLFALVLVVTMVFSFAACTKDDATSNESTSDTTADPASDTTAEGETEAETEPVAAG
jgi:hypothetical protein